MAGYILFVDDIRDPENVIVNKDHFENLVVVRNSQEAIDVVIRLGCPSMMYLDHDLGIVKGVEDDSMRFLKWFIFYDLDQDYITKDLKWEAHSANPVGVANINGILDAYMKFKFKDQ